MSKQELPVLASECCTPLIAEPIAEDEAAEMARVFKALGDPIRLRLLSLIGAQENGRRIGDGVCVCELTGAFEVTAPTISHHLKVLREAGLIDSQRRGTWVYYWIIPASLKRLTSVLALPETLAADAR
ncbi:metalloregulator ArsR/SmtB family transcription factor [Nonomuraea sp. NPDC049625]|uniref:ArsR/SmtB family transcription factor n=1 Tax=Nonomuraea sp. NPDC049625 TaxID=3155775 RepID=UPI00341864D8